MEETAHTEGLWSICHICNAFGNGPELGWAGHLKGHKTGIVTAIRATDAALAAEAAYAIGGPLAETAPVARIQISFLASRSAIQNRLQHAGVRNPANR